MSDYRAETLVRKMAERWWIQVCPECNGLVGDRSEVHSGTCPNRYGRVFVPRDVEVTPALRPVGKGIDLPEVDRLVDDEERA